MNTFRALIPLVLLVTACVAGEHASSQAVAASVGRVWYYSFERQRITGLLEEEIERYGCPFEITKEAFDRATASERSEAPYNPQDVRARIIFDSETIFIDRFGLARRIGGEEFLVDKKLSLFVVADGMGGHAAGEVASAIAVRTIHEEIKRERDLLTDFVAGARGASRVTNKDVLSLMEHAVRAMVPPAARQKLRKAMGRERPQGQA